MKVQAVVGDEIHVLKLEPEDVEEAIFRCGFGVVDEAGDITAAHRREIERCERQGACSQFEGRFQDAREWWDARVVERRSLFTA